MSTSKRNAIKRRIEILERAKTRLWDGIENRWGAVPKKKFICHAISHYTCGDGNTPEPQARFLQNWITRDLFQTHDQVMSLEVWLFRKGHIKSEMYAYTLSGEKKAQRTRIKWLNWMIQHWKGELAKLEQQ